MIGRLIVKNSVAFEDVDLEFQNGFNVFSGASGSGKSVLMESLLAIFGLKESNAELIEANLDISLGDFGVNLEEFGLLDESDPLVLSIVKKDKTRYFLNRYVSSRKRLGELVAQFGKHIASKGANELKTENILRVFDDFIAQKIPTHKELLSKLSESFVLLLDVRATLAMLIEEEENIQSLKEFAEFEIQKISSLNPQEGEYEKLLELKKSLSKKEKIQESIQAALGVFEDLPKIFGALALIGKENKVLEDSTLEARGILEEENERLNELDELNIEEMLNRITELSELNRRYGSIQDALLHLQTQKQKLQDYQNLSFNKEKLNGKIKNLELACQELAVQISQNRKAYLQAFQKEIATLCVQLLLKAPNITLEGTEMKKSGTEQIELKLESAGVEALSSGEYNRLRLAMMCLDAKINHSKGILVLDEIDANLSGEESEGVAKVLKSLSKTYQIFAISHQPHMPALADWHYLVAKKEQKNGEQKSHVQLLDKEGRILEMARMISGADITKEALEFAKKKLEQNCKD
ncbi:AAA family ATPase [Helicobacter sp. 11S02596-1]|uniref:AAA family ATPase n=1 Tax=Helicobacter sp. 11S02596-1 TaxID=1476194 RepID=UPI000BA512B9|nr:AAA family ATPase [Helicobacter sp. 11S02596-1]